MGDNLRESFRIGADAGLEVELEWNGRARRCTLRDLSAGGARVVSTVELGPGAPCTLRVRLAGPAVGVNQAAWAELPMAVLDAAAAQGGGWTLRMRGTESAGSAAYERVAKLVFEAQRRMRAKESGASVASPMASDAERRRALRPSTKARFSRGSTRPDGGTP